MKKGFNYIAIILLSVAAVPAQAAIKQGLTDLGRSREGEKTASKRKEDVSRRDSRVLRIGPSTTFLKNGLSIDEVVRVLGKPVSVSERQEGGLRLATYVFSRSEGRILLAEFENGALVRSRTEVIKG